MAIDFPIGTDFPANGDQIPDGHEYEGFYWDATTGAWKRICAEDQIGDCLEDGQTVCDRLVSIEGNIIELEEEIDAIAPSVERGLWTMNASGVVSSQGQLSLYDDNYTNVGNPTDLFKDAKSIWLNELDNDGTPHGFEGVTAGEFIELFIQGKAEYGLYEVVEAHDETNGASQWWVIEVVFVRTLEDTSTADNGDIIRIKIFNAPSGGDASGFVLKIGDEMSGDLTMGEEPLPPGSPSPKIEFKSSNDAGDRTYVNSLYMVKNNAYLNTSGDFSAGGALSANGNIQYGGTTRIGMASDSSTHYLGIGTSSSYNALQWNKSKGVINIRANNGWGSNGQVLKKSHNDNTVGWEGAIGINTDGSNRAKGEMWYNPNDGTLYLKVS